MSSLGIVLYHGIQSGPELKEYGRIAEEAGFESLWVTERYFHEETFSLLGFLGAATKRLRLGVGVANPFTRNPAVLAMATATLDRITGGRFTLGLGRSDRSVIQDLLGIPYSNPLGGLQEAVALLRTLLSGAPATHDDAAARLTDIRLAISPVQARVPIYLAAIGPRALQLVGTVADGALLNAYVPIPYIKWAIKEIRTAAQVVDRNPSLVRITCMLPIRLTDDPDSIWPTLKQRIVRLLQEPHVGEILLEKGGFDPLILPELRSLFTTGKSDWASRLISDDMVDSFYVVGSEEHCRERIKEYRNAGVDLPLLLPTLGDFRRVANSLCH